jgi:hypothetical protein
MFNKFIWDTQVKGQTWQKKMPLNKSEGIFKRILNCVLCFISSLVPTFDKTFAPSGVTGSGEETSSGGAWRDRSPPNLPFA